MTTSPTDSYTRKTTRRELRARRRKLESAERRNRERAIVSNVQRMRAYQRARRVAVYFGVDGEVDLRPIVEHARSNGKSIFAPVLARNGLRFIEIGTRWPCRRNRFGIPEPSHGKRIDPQSLDIVLAPLVAFDARGHRLGMGKAYYDRTFGFLRLRSRWRRPKLIGIGFDFQKIDRLVPQRWDVPLWSAVTDAGIDYFEDATNNETLATKI